MPDFTVFALLWAISALLAATIGAAKGHSFAAWLILGGLFGIFAVVYVAFAARETQD